MRTLSIHEVQYVSGANNSNDHFFSDAFLAGMKGGHLDDSLYVITGSALGALIGFVPGALGLSSAIGNLAVGIVTGSIAGAAIGGLVGYAWCWGQYHLGQNYVEAMKIINS
ncbi:MAG: hypothetical protein JSR17_08625 [Proteobacteria bacterium]|nr:hypothetical protein [Pseudomonadota bacterium]